MHLTSLLRHQGALVELTWSGRRDLTTRPLDPQSSVLPGCATARRSSNRTHALAGGLWSRAAGQLLRVRAGTLCASAIRFPSESLNQALLVPSGISTRPSRDLNSG